jgi:undecaprenyl-diphosphatase
VTRRAAWLSALWVILLGAAFAIDRPVARLMAGVGPMALRVFEAVTWFGQGGVILYPTAAIMLVSGTLAWLTPARERPDRRRTALVVFRYAVTIFTVVAAAGLADDVLKIAFGRARPRLWLAGDDSGFQALRYGAKFASFPSGHTTTSVAGAAVLCALFPRGKGFFITVAILIALSRIILDAHYVSDVVAGAALGGLVALKILDQFRKSGWSPGWKATGGNARDDAPPALPPLREQ